MIKDEIKELLNEKNNTTVSIIIPTHRTSPDRIIDEKILIKAIHEAKELLIKQTSDEKEISNVLQKLDEYLIDIDNNHNKEGLGIYVSNNFSKLIKFPFPVNYKIKIGKTFESRDLLYFLETVFNYHVLSITHKHIRMFKGFGEELEEVTDGTFPLDYFDNYEYASPTRATSFSSNVVKEFEKDKSILQQIRLKDFLRKADQLLLSYLSDNSPLIIAGGTKEISEYFELSHFQKQIIGRIKGNYNYNGNIQLANHSWEVVNNYLNNHNKELISALHELKGKNLVMSGIVDVWKCANAGMGLNLVIEKDYECKGYLRLDETEFSLERPTENDKYFITDNICERLIAIVKSKGGKITFVSNLDLADYFGIALRLRYPITTI